MIEIIKVRKDLREEENEGVGKGLGLWNPGSEKGRIQQKVRQCHRGIWRERLQRLIHPKSEHPEFGFVCGESPTHPDPELSWHKMDLTNLQVKVKPKVTRNCSITPCQLHLTQSTQTPQISHVWGHQKFKPRFIQNIKKSSKDLSLISDKSNLVWG